MRYLARCRVAPPAFFPGFPGFFRVLPSDPLLDLERVTYHEALHRAVTRVEGARVALVKEPLRMEDESGGR
jgi:hypothetical protein